MRQFTDSYRWLEKRVLMMRRLSRALDRWHAKRKRIHREAEAFVYQIYASYEIFLCRYYEEQHHSMAPERIAADLMNHNMSDSHIGTIGRALEDWYKWRGQTFPLCGKRMTPAYEQRLWNAILHDVNSLLLEEDQFFGYFLLNDSSHSLWYGQCFWY